MTGRASFGCRPRQEEITGEEQRFSMAGQIKRLISELIDVRTRRRPNVEHFVRAHLVLNGIDPDLYDDYSEDDPEKIHLLQTMIRGFQRR
jgi:hypothetical protein